MQKFHPFHPKLILSLQEGCPYNHGPYKGVSLYFGKGKTHIFAFFIIIPQFQLRESAKLQQSKKHSCAPSLSSLVRLVAVVHHSSFSSIGRRGHRLLEFASKCREGKFSQRGSRGRSVRVRLLGCTGEPLCCSLLDLEKDGKLQLELSGPLRSSFLPSSND